MSSLFIEQPFTTDFRNTANKTAEIDRTRRISLGQIHPARINTRILTNMITQVLSQDHLKVDGLRNQTVKDSSERSNKQKLTWRGLELSSLLRLNRLIFLDRCGTVLLIGPFTFTHGRSITVQNYQLWSKLFSGFASVSERNVRFGPDFILCLNFQPLNIAISGLWYGTSGRKRRNAFWSIRNIWSDSRYKSGISTINKWNWRNGWDEANWWNWT